MQVTPVLPGSFDLHARLGWEPILLRRIAELQRGEINFRTQRLQADVLQRIGNSSLDLGDGACLRIDPGCTAEFQRVLPSPQGQGSGRFHTGNMLEADFLQVSPLEQFLPRQAEREGCRIVRMKYQEKRSEAVAQEHRGVPAIPLGFMHRKARLRKIEFATGVCENYQVIE